MAAQKILITGASGMLGHTMLRFLARKFDVYGTIRSKKFIDLMPDIPSAKFIIISDLLDYNNLRNKILQLAPHIIINCAGLIKQQANTAAHIQPINTALPHTLAALAGKIGSRLIHYSTDCVFSGARGNYTETDLPDASDPYGQTKYAGEIDNLRHVLTLRTSIIGHELDGRKFSLLEWFLSNTTSVKGFTKARFSGLPAVEHARIIVDYILANPELCGLYHVAAAPIDKYRLLKLIAEVYAVKTGIIPCDKVIMDRTLDATCFNQVTGYHPPAWSTLITDMHAFG